MTNLQICPKTNVLFVLSDRLVTERAHQFNYDGRYIEAYDYSLVESAIPVLPAAVAQLLRRNLASINETATNDATPVHL